MRVTDPSFSLFCERDFGAGRTGILTIEDNLYLGHASSEVSSTDGLNGRTYYTRLTQ
jgi:hypothetical protein